MWQKELALASGLGGDGRTWETTLPTAPHLCPCRDTDIYDDIEIYGRCTELLPYPFSGHSDPHTSTRIPLLLTPCCFAAFLLSLPSV